MLAERLCRPFTWEVVSKLPPEEFCVTRADVLACPAPIFFGHFSPGFEFS